MSEIRRGIAIVHYNRAKHIKKVVEGVLDTCPRDINRIVVCDDGSTQSISNKIPKQVMLIRGQNKGVSANKNRALWALQDCHFLTIIEDDLLPTKKGWFENYERAACITEENHFCRVQDKEIPETIPEFSKFLKENRLSPIFGPSPRGDLTFITNKVLHTVGAFNPLFKGVGYAHGEWSNRVIKAKLLQHPLKWIDIKESRDSFEQLGDTDGGRWNEPKGKIDEQIKQNRRILKQLEQSSYTYHPLVFD